VAVYTTARRDEDDPETMTVRIPIRLDHSCTVLRGPWVAIGNDDQPTVLPFDRATGEAFTLASARRKQWDAAQSDRDVWVLRPTNAGRARA
jgi:hypothetical protein